MQFTYNYCFKPRHSDFDDYQIAHHSKYLCWFEEARYECFQQFEKYYDAICNKYKMPVTKVHCKYYQMVSSVENMVIQVSLELPITSSILHLNYRLMDVNQKKLYAKGYTEHIFMTDSQKLSKDIPEEFLKLMEKIMKQNN